MALPGLAREEKWEALADLEKRRNKIIVAFFEQPNAKSAPSELEVGIRGVLDLDQKIIQICRFRKNSICEKLNRFRVSRRAKNAYSQNSF